LACLICLLGFTHAEVDQTIKDLGSERAVTRSEAAERLIRIGSPAVKPLHDALRKGDFSLRREVAYILGAIGSAESTEPLVAALADEDADVRMASAWALVQIGPAASSSLVDALGSKNARTRRGAEIALVKIGDSAVPELIKGLKKRNGTIRMNSARVLGRIGDPRSADSLKKLLKDKNEGVRKEAEIALTRIEKQKP
jgi:HEAT repeat protein